MRWTRVATILEGRYRRETLRMTEESAVRVCVRVRPLIEREAETPSAEASQLYWKADKLSIHQIDDGNITKSFSFDRVFSSEESTNQLYQSIAKSLVVSTVEGYNGTIFAYGQTSSGKTFTMMGSEHSPGVIPQAVEDVFQTIKNCPKKEFLLRVSYMEIYNETVTDLLCDSWKRKPLEIREGNYKNVYVADLTEELVTSPQQVLAWIGKGEKNRHYGKTKMNQRSSRSHTIFRMILESRERSDQENADGAIIVSHLNLVDLAGAERASQTGAEGARFKEGCNINRSLSTLGQVIKKLSEENQRGFINYRDSKLTRILQNSLGGNAKTVIICTVTPAAADETLSTLQFASAAKRMKNDPHVTEVSDDGALLRRYRNEIVELRQRLQEVSSVTQTTVTEKETLCQLLQEKEQLQRDQEDRIRNLTKLLVTASNVVPARKLIPRRRMTWGGKLLRRALSPERQGEADVSLLEPLVKRRVVDMSTLSEQSEDMEDSRWDIPEDRVFELELNQSNVTHRSSSENMFERLTCLEERLERELQQREEVQLLLQQEQEKVEQLKQQLENRSSPPSQRDFDQVKKDLGDTIHLCETLACEKEDVLKERDLLGSETQLLIGQVEHLQLEIQALEKEVQEKMEIKEFDCLEEEAKKDYERELLGEIGSLKETLQDSQQQNHRLQAELDVALKQNGEQMMDLQNLHDKDLLQEVKRLRRSLEDAERLSLETKKDWAFLRTDNLELQERDVRLSADHQRMEAELRGAQAQLEAEKTRFRKMQTDLQKELMGAFDENTKLTALLDGKVPKGLLDSITLERVVSDQKAELLAEQQRAAELHQQVQELMGQLRKVEAEGEQVLTVQQEVQRLEQECSDSSCRLDEAQAANAQLTEELQHLRSEREQLEEKLREGERRRVEELEELRSDREQLEEKEKLEEKLREEERRRVEELRSDREQLEEKLREEERRRVEELEELQSDKEQLEEKLREEERRRVEELQHLQSDKEQLEEKLREEERRRVEELEELHSHVNSLSAERDQLLEQQMVGTVVHSEDLERLRSDVGALTAERDQLVEMMEGLREERSQLKRDLEDNLDQQCVETQSEVLQLKNQLSPTPSLAQEQMQQELEVLRREKEQLQADIQENVDMMIENQNELREALEKIRVLKKQKASEDQLRTSLQDMELQLEELQKEQDRLLQEHSEELQRLHSDREQLEEKLREEERRRMEELHSCVNSLSAERDQLQEQQMEGTVVHSEDLERLRSDVGALTAERDQLVEMMEGLREERSQLKRDLEDKLGQAEEAESQLQSLQEKLSQSSDNLSLLQDQVQHLTAELESVRSEKELLFSKDLQGAEELQRLQSDKEQLEEKLREEERKRVEELHSHVNSLSADRDQLQEQQIVGTVVHSEDLERLRSDVGALTVERDHLVEMMEGLREERSQLKRDLEDKLEQLLQAQKELKSVHADEGQRQQFEAQAEEAESQLQSLQEKLSQSSDNLSLLQDQVQHLTAELESVRSEKELLFSKDLQGAEELQRLQSDKEQLEEKLREEERRRVEELEELRSDREKLEEKLREGERRRVEELEELHSRVNSLSAERDQLQEQQMVGTVVHSEDLERLRSDVAALTAERDQLVEMMEGLREERSQLKRDLEDKAEEAESQLQSLQEKLSQSSDNLSLLQDQVQHLTAELESVRSEKELLFSKDLQGAEELQRLQEKLEEKLREEERSRVEELQHLQSDREKLEEKLREEERRRMEELPSHVNSLSADRDQLQEQQIVGTVVHSEDLERLRSDVGALTAEKDQLVEMMEGLREERSQLKRDLEDKLDQIQRVKEPQFSDPRALAKSSEDSAQMLQVCLQHFQVLLDRLTQVNDERRHVIALESPDPAERGFSISLLRLVPSDRRAAFLTFTHKLRDVGQYLFFRGVALRKLCQCYMGRAQSVWQQGVDSFEQSQLQDLLLRKSTWPGGAPGLPPPELQQLWVQRLRLTLDRRQRHLQDMEQVVRRLAVAVDAYEGDLSAEQLRRGRMAERLRDLSSGDVQDSSAYQAFLLTETERAASAASTQRATYQLWRDELQRVGAALDSARSEAQLCLSEQRSETLGLFNTSIQETVTPSTTLRDKQGLREQLQQVLDQKLRQLMQDQHLSAQLQEKEQLILALQEQLTQMQSGAALEEMKNQLVQMELENTRMSANHQKEMERVNVTLEHKEDVIRSLKENLRKNLQQEEHSCQCHGPNSTVLLLPDQSFNINLKSLKFTFPKLSCSGGRHTWTPDPQHRTAHLESLVSSQQEEITKWRRRAYKLREHKKEEPLSCPPVTRHAPRTPPRHALPASPVRRPAPLTGAALLNSPKSRFFDLPPTAQAPPITQPRLFFDNSALGAVAGEQPTPARSTEEPRPEAAQEGNAVHSGYFH
ncbi:centromere-associated protein E-like [Denticeps clupeoides]|uniref:centromere-associated protein E-like n=1 Tax=Denticeps clupeoides TaxID=299321 RepID=UPI0010A3DE30|nr:centromere-associated protein E-like [Denticeps clupeoides]